MSSPSPQVPYVRRRSLAGPLVLIVLGVVFLLGNMRVLTWPRLGHYFALYWPVLLILWGLVKLVEHTRDTRAGLPSRGIGAGGVLLIIFIVICGLAFTGAERVNWSAIGNEMDVDSDFAGFFGNTYAFSHTLEQPFPADTSLRVVSDRGAVTVNAWEEPRIKVVVSKKLVARSEEESKNVDQQTEPQISTEGHVMTLNANTTAGGTSHPVESTLEIYLPRKAAVDISTRRGDVVVRGRTGAVKLSTTRGDASVQDISGDVTMDVRRGSLRASDVQGDVSANGRVDDTNFSNVSGSVRLTGEFFGEMNLSKVGKMVSFKSTRTDLEFARLDGEMTMQSGDLRAKSVAGPVRLLTRSKDIHIEDFSGELRVENSNGIVELRAGKLPLGPMEITNRRGEIQVVLPPQATFELDATAHRGDINSEFQNIKVANARNESRASGAVGTGGPRLQINNDNGNIEIRKAGSNVTSLPGTQRDSVVVLDSAYDIPDTVAALSNAKAVSRPAAVRRRVRPKCVFTSKEAGTL